MERNVRFSQMGWGLHVESFIFYEQFQRCIVAIVKGKCALLNSFHYALKMPHQKKHRPVLRSPDKNVRSTKFESSFHGTEVPYYIQSDFR